MLQTPHIISYFFAYICPKQWFYNNCHLQYSSPVGIFPACILTFLLCTAPDWWVISDSAFFRCLQMVQEGTPIEEAMEEVIGCGTTCMSTLPMEFLCEDQSLRDPRVGRDGGSKCTTKRWWQQLMGSHTIESVWVCIRETLGAYAAYITIHGVEGVATDGFFHTFWGRYPICKRD